MPNSKLHPRGFTLIEIMIAVAIVGVIFGVIITSAASVRKNSRDAQRQADLFAIQSAMQNYYADQNYFPNSPPTSNNVASYPSGAITNCAGIASGCTVSRTYMPLIPADPSSVNYKYKAVLDATTANRTTECTSSSNPNSCHFYYLCATLENATPQTASQNADCTNSTTGFGSGYNFQVNP